jgi:PAS domain S-box-containing protein
MPDPSVRSSRTGYQVAITAGENLFIGGFFNYTSQQPDRHPARLLSAVQDTRGDPLMTAKKAEKKASSRPGKTASTTEKITKSEKTYRGIFEHSGIPAVVIGEDSVILLANRRFEELSGYPRGEMEGKKPWTEFVNTGDIEKTGTYITEILKPKGWAPAQYSFGFVDRNRIIRDISASMTLITGTRKILISLVDITSRKTVERLLRLNEERYHSLVKTLKTGVFRSTHELPGRFIWANPAFLSMFGYGSLKDLLKITTADIIADHQDLRSIFEELDTSGFARLEKIRLEKADGAPFWASITMEVKRKEDGTSPWVDGTVENITERVRAGEELKRTQSRLGELLNAVTTYSLFATDPEGILTMFNTGSEQMLGYRAEDLIGRETPLLFLQTPEPAARGSPPEQEGESRLNNFAAFISGAKANGCDEREWTCVRKDGVQIPVDLTLTVMHNEDRIITGYLGVAQEISDRKRLEEAFRYDTLQMSGVIYNLPDPTFAIDRTGRVIAWNRAIEDMSNTRAVDILGKGDYAYAVPFYGDRRPMLADLIFSTDTEIEQQGYYDIRRSGNSITAETCLMNPGGGELVLRGIAAPIYDDTGEIAGAIESITDITDVRKRESELQDSESRFRAVLDYIGSAVAILEEDATISYINPEFERIIGYVREEVEGKKRWTEFIAPEDLERMHESLRGSHHEPAMVSARFEFRFIRWDGQVRHGLLSVSPVPDTARTIISLIDITDRVLAEEAVQRANKKLNFFSQVTRHEILNQLTALKGHLELSKECTADSRLLTSLEKGLAAAEAIQSQILFTRDYQNIGIQPPEWQNVRDEILKSCTGIPMGKVTVSVLITGVEIYADLLLGRVFFHLINNAIRHGGTLTEVRFMCEESFEELVLVCEDDGVGIPADAKEKIFNRQFFAGSGLGMFVSREILSITGISIRETGTPGKGARFEIRVPKGAYRFINDG